MVTQYLAEYVLNKRFDGILYPSASGEGANLVLFDPAKAQVGEVTQYRVKSMEAKYDWQEVEPEA